MMVSDVSKPIAGFVSAVAPIGAAAMLFAGALPAAGAIVHVAPAGASRPQAPCDTWAGAANDLRAAVEYANERYPDCDTVLIGNGT